jgi:hypothetical protein
MDGNLGGTTSNRVCKPAGGRVGGGGGGATLQCSHPPMTEHPEVVARPKSPILMKVPSVLHTNRASKPCMGESCEQLRLVGPDGATSYAHGAVERVVDGVGEMEWCRPHAPLVGKENVGALDVPMDDGLGLLTVQVVQALRGTVEGGVGGGRGAGCQDPRVRVHTARIQTSPATTTNIPAGCSGPAA